jgi:ABC-2 type transport system permease protein
MNEKKTMNKHIFQFELRSHLKSMLTWSISLAALILFFFSFYPVFADQAEMVNVLMQNFPPELRAVFGMDDLDMASVLGFFSFIFMFVQLCLAVQASNYGFGLLSKEESELTADFLLSKPVSRMAIFNSKLLASLTSLAITNVVVWLCSYAAVELFKAGRGYDKGTLLLLMISAFIFQLFFLGVGMLISLLVKRVRSVTPYALGLGFGMYVLSAFTGLFDEVALELVTPFKHFDAAYIVANQAFDTRLVILNVAVTVLSVAASIWLYNRRNVPAVS